MLAVVIDLLVFLAGSAGLGAAVRAWRAGPGDRPVPGWWGVLGYTLAVLAFFSPALLTSDRQIATDIPYQTRPWNETLAEPVKVGNPLLSDPPYQMLPFRDLVRRRWLAGEPPLWANELATGQPLLANAQSAPFAPLHLPLLPLPTLRALDVAVGWQVVLGLLLMHALLRRLRASPAGAVVAALAFGFGTFSVAWAYYPMGMTAMFVPGVLLGVLLMAEGAPRGAPGLVVCGLAMALSGHPETVAHTALAAAVVVGWLLLRWPREKNAPGRDQTRLRYLGRLAVAGALTFALAAPYLLPILESLPASERAAALELHPRSERPSDFTVRHLAWLVDPVVKGNPREGGWAGPANFNEHASLYCGVLTLVLALAGAAVLRGRVAVLVIAGTLGLMGAFRLEPVHGLLTALPVLGDGAHGRLRLFWALAVAVAAGLSLDELFRSRAGRGVFALLLAVALGLLIWLGAAPPWWLQLWRLAVLVGGLGVLAVPWALSWAGSPRGSLDRLRPLWVTAVIGVLALDLFLLGMRYNARVPAELDLAPPPVVAWMVERQREALEGPGELHPFRVLGEDWALFPNVPALYGLWNLRGYDPARPAAPARFVDLATQGEHQPGGRAKPHRVSRANVAAHSFLGVRYLLTRHRRKPPAPVWQRVHRHTGGRVWENTRVLPIFFIPREMAAVAGSERALERALEIEDYARRGVVEIGVEEGPGDIPGASWEQEGSVRIIEVTGNRFGMEVASPGGAVVVSSVSHDPGWRVRLDGEPVPLLRANSAFLAFRVPPGEHGAELVYSPRGWRWGWGLCALAVIALAGRWLFLRRRSAPVRPIPDAAPPPAGSRPPAGPAAGSPAPSPPPAPPPRRPPSPSAPDRSPRAGF